MSRAGGVSMAPLPVGFRPGTTTQWAAKRAGRPPPFGTQYKRSMCYPCYPRTQHTLLQVVEERTCRYPGTDSLRFSRQ